jgi:hypothetical protein
MRAESIPAGESDFVNLIIPCLKIFGNDESACGILLSSHTQNRTWKIAEQSGASFSLRGVGNDLQYVGHRPIGAVGEKFPTTRVARRSENRSGAPIGFCGMAVSNCGGHPREVAAFGGEQNGAPAGVQREFAVRVARWREVGRGEGNRLRKLAGRVYADNREFRALNEDENHTGFGAIPERRSIEDALRSLIDELPFDADGHNGKAGSTERSARKSEEAHFVLIGNANGRRENELRRSFGDADAEKRCVGIIGQENVAGHHFLVEGFLPFLGGVGRKVRVLQKYEVEWPVEVGYGSDALGELPNGIIEGRTVSGETGARHKESEEKAEKEAREGQFGADSNWVHGVLCHDNTRKTSEAVS